MTKNSNCFGTGDETRVGVYRLNNYTNYIKNNDWWFNPGESKYPDASHNSGTPSMYTWVCPPGVTKVSAVVIGGGGGGGNSWAESSGSGGGFAYKNNIVVVPGTSYTVQVGSGGTKSGNRGGTMSYFINTSTVVAGGGANQSGPESQSDWTPNAGPENRGGGWSGDGGGHGGRSQGWDWGAGAGGWSGRGGQSNGQDGQGGAGGAGSQHSSTWGTGAGGGTGWYEQGNNGRGGGTIGSGSTRGIQNGWWGQNGSGTGGEGGSKGAGPYSGYYSGYCGACGENAWGFPRGNNATNGGWPGGGSGGAGTSAGGGQGGWGGVRIIWEGEMYGTSRSFPNNNCTELDPAQGYTMTTNNSGY